MIINYTNIDGDNPVTTSIMDVQTKENNNRKTRGERLMSIAQFLLASISSLYSWAYESTEFYTKFQYCGSI